MQYTLVEVTGKNNAFTLEIQLEDLIKKLVEV